MSEKKMEPQQDYSAQAAELAQELVNKSYDPDSAIHGIRCFVSGTADKWQIVDDCSAPDIARTVIQELESRQYKLGMQASPTSDFDSHFVDGLRRYID